MDDVTGPAAPAAALPNIIGETRDTIAMLDANTRRIIAAAAQLRDENNRLRLAILGGEDAPGYAASLPVESVIQALDSERREALRRAEAAESTLDLLTGEIEGLIGESRGVAGLHLNGDEAPWSELVAGGRFERLTTLPEATALLLALGRRTEEAPAPAAEAAP